MLVSKLPAQGGFTLVEMMVVVTIVIIITAVAIANLPAFRDSTQLDLLAQEVAVVIRQAQVFGSGTRVFGDSPQVFPSHGIHFDITDSDSFILFADVADPNDIQPVGNHIYDPGEGCGGVITECREQFNLHGGVEISGFYTCTTCALVENEQTMDITFQRPEPDATFFIGVNPAGASRVVVELTSLRITDPTINRRWIVVSSTGQIYVCNPGESNSICE